MGFVKLMKLHYTMLRPKLKMNDMNHQISHLYCLDFYWLIRQKESKVYKVKITTKMSYSLCVHEVLKLIPD